MKRTFSLLLMAFAIQFIHATSSATAIVEEFGATLSSWCKTDNIMYREKLEKLCSGLKSCRVEDKVLADYLYLKGQPDHETFCLDSYLNMFENEISNKLSIEISDMKIEAEDKYPDGQSLTFISANLQMKGKMNYNIKELFLVRNEKISGIYSYDKSHAFSHLNGSLIATIQRENFTYIGEILNNYAVVRKEKGQTGFIDLKGNILIPCIYDAVEYHGTNFVRAYNYNPDKPKKDIWYDLRNGIKETPFEDIYIPMLGRNHIFGDFYEGKIAVAKNGKYGFMAEDDLEYKKVQYKYDNAYRFIDGYALVELDGVERIINSNYKVMMSSTSKYQILGNPYEGRVKVRDRATKKFGFTDLKGKLVIPCIYDYAQDFHEGLCFVEMGKKGGCIDNVGREVMPLEDGLSPWNSFENGCVPLRKWVTIEKYKDGVVKRERALRETLVGKDGKPLKGFDWDYKRIIPCDPENCIWYQDVNEKYGYLNMDGTPMVFPSFERAWDFKNGYACVQMSVNGTRKYGAINRDGVLIVPYLYDAEVYFSNGIAAVVKDGKAGIIDVYGNSTFK